MSNNQANHTSTRREDWCTPPDISEALWKVHDFVIDLCASPENSLCDNCVTEAIDLMSPKGAGLVAAVSEGCNSAKDHMEYAWINPPYRAGKTGLLIARAAELCLANNLGLVALIPAEVGSRWWCESVEPFFDFVILTPWPHFVGAEGAEKIRCAICIMAPFSLTPMHSKLGAIYERVWDCEEQ